jgi:nucleoporin POM34
MSSTAVMKQSPAASRFVAPTTPMRPSSPAPSTPQQSPVKVDTPGTWRHPKMDEINRRKNASTFSSDNLRSLWINLGIGLAFLFGPGLLSP